MDRNTTIAFILIGGILVLWLYLNSPTPPPPQKGKKTDTTQVHKDTTKSVVVPKKTQKTQQKVTTPVKTENNQDSLKVARNYGKYFSYSDSAGSIITIENDLVKLELDTRGANIKKYFLKNYNNWYSAGTKDTTEENFYKTHVQLINYSKGNALDLAFVSSDGKAINTKNLLFNLYSFTDCFMQ